MVYRAVRLSGKVGGARSVRVLFNVNVAWFLISHRLEVARAALACGHDVHVCSDTATPDEAAMLKREGFVFHHVRLRRGGLSPGHDLAYLCSLINTMRRVSPDIVHNITVKPVIYGTVAANMCGIHRVVNAVSGLGYAFSGRGPRRLISKFVTLSYRAALRRRGVIVVFQNDDDASAFVEAGVVKQDQVVIIRGSGVDLDRFEYTKEPDGPAVVVLPARMLRDKGVVEFAEAAEIVRSAGHRGEFLLAGPIDRENRTGLSEWEIRELEQRTGVRWIGHVGDMAKLYSKSHIVVLPSYREGMPKALLEACAAGRPIVTTNVPGCRDVVTHGENGFIVRPRDAGALAAAIDILIEDAPLRRRMGMAGRERAEAQFDVKRVVAATLEVYRSLAV